MSEATKCIRCQGAMEAGYIVDFGGGISRQHWFAGEPVKAFLSGLKVKWSQRVPTRTYRCENCGYLESYANPRLILDK